MDEETLAKECTNAAWPKDNAIRSFGLELVKVGPGKATIKMVITESMLNSFDFCHGGFIFSLADVALAVASNTYNERAVAQNCQITYLNPARLGDVIIAEARELLRDKRTGIYDVTIRKNAEPIAEFRGLSRVIGGKIIEID